MAKKKDKHQHKTNAVRIVEAAGIPYEMHEYEAPEGFLDGVSVAKALGQEPGSVFKTLVTVGQSREYYVCEIPVDKELDLKKAAKHFGEKKLEMLPSRLLTATTGYIKGGCSPVGMKKEFPTAIDASVKSMRYRLSRREDDYCIECSTDGIHFSQMRICHMIKGG